MTNYTTATIEGTEELALAITREQYARGAIDHGEFAARVSAIIGLNGSQERARVLHTDDIVDITGFGTGHMVMASGWSWPETPA